MNKAYFLKTEPSIYIFSNDVCLKKNKRNTKLVYYIKKKLFNINSHTID